MDVEQVYREAVARVLARRHEQKPMQPGESIVPRSDFEAPRNAGQWADDRISRTPPVLGEWVAVAYEIALTAGDKAAAVKAVRSAQTLKNPWDQYHLHEALTDWRRDLISDVATAMTEVKYEWEDLGLPMAAPVDQPLPPTSRRWQKEKEKEKERPKVKYRSRWGHPAGMAY